MVTSSSSSAEATIPRSAVVSRKIRSTHRGRRYRDTYTRSPNKPYYLPRRARLEYIVHHVATAAPSLNPSRTLDVHWAMWPRTPQAGPRSLSLNSVSPLLLSSLLMRPSPQNGLDLLYFRCRKMLSLRASCHFQVRAVVVLSRPCTGRVGSGKLPQHARVWSKSVRISNWRT